ncbi:variant erythrocyte surface antigen-1 family protein [Babesia caballi]|uniref:Variant erythrocyte surface antigen-1 family protein n=1 Tax=Babesia caballi TaxID=5871 RepID=A0AAV4LT94_BABCB|nr:variant erythrocyte surface antigen-1 family protein [Babesia caballi]
MGKDGGSASGNETKLAKAITRLTDFQEAIEAAARKLSESGSNGVSQALQKLQVEDTLRSMISKLAEGLKVFIGYGSNGEGIALVIDPLQQLRKGVLIFLNIFLSQLRNYINNDTDIMGELNRARMGSGGATFESAIEKVGQLKEASSSGRKIPQVVSALNKVSGLISQKDAHTFPEAASTYLTGVLEAVVTDGKNQAPSQVGSLKNSLPALVEAYGNRSDIDGQMKTVENEYKQLNRNGSRNVGEILGSAVYYGTESLLIPLKKTDGYKSCYIPSSGWNGGADNNTISRIFLGCLPLYYYWLTYLYWKCKHGDWAGQILSRPTLKNFMVGQGYLADHLSTQKGSEVATLLQSLGMSSAIAPKPSHPELLGALDQSLQKVISSLGSTIAQSHSLSALFYVCRYYFTGKQSMQSGSPAFKPRPPTSIREMLYWLSGLQFSPNYYDIEKQIESHIPNNGLHVADSAINTSNNMITRDQMKGFLLSSCLSAPGVLGAIQGNSADTDGEPWLYSLFCNSMNLRYPSGSALFNKLANYAYALQFQLHFLYRQCRTNYSQSYGWQWCRYGQGVGSSSSNDANELASWICSAPNCTTHSCPHNSNACQHFQQCGQANKHSPLQAFLTDNLKGFHVAHQANPTSPNHLHNHPPGYMCHIPMGFAGALTTDANATGWYIYYLLEHFCGSSKTPLRQLCEKLGCLTKRTPRTLGDLFGFLWHLNGQLFGDKKPIMADMAKKLVDTLGSRPMKVPDFFVKLLKSKASQNASGSGSPTALSRSLEAMAPSIPFLYQLFMSDPKDFLPMTLFDLKGTTHKGSPSYTGPHNDLYSLQNPQCTGLNCGTYLSPLCYSNGSAFAPKHASSYFSWVLYLVDDLETGLRDMLDEFTNIDCKNSGCHGQKCHGEHGLGQHGSSDTQCQCESVVQCGGVLPILYSNGFSFASAYSLKGGQSSSKKTCQNFHDQLTAVLAQNENTPLFKLLLAIDDFLYMFRIYFFYNLSTFWILYVCIVVYIYFLRADLLHVKSHVRLPSSHGVPSISLLPTGKPTVLTKLTKLTYFIP